MQIEITGKIVSVLPEQKFNGKNGEIVKNSFVIEWQDSGFTQHLCLEVVGKDKFDKMKQSVAVGNTVLCKFSVSSREYQGRFYTSASCFYCANVGGQQQPQTQQSQQNNTQQQDNSIPF